MLSSDLLPAPVWLTEKDAQPVVELMRWFIRRLDELPQEHRTRPLTRKLDKKSCPALFNFRDAEHIVFLKGLISQLAEAPWHIWKICQRREISADSLEPVRSLQFNPATEHLLRNWLAMPLVDPLEVSWRSAVERDSYWTEPQKSLLIQLGYPGIFTPLALLHSLRTLGEYLTEYPSVKLSWRRCSARFFFGQSKYLDDNFRRSWLLRFFPVLETIIDTRPILLNVHLTAGATSIVIVENQDTFCWLTKGSHPFEGHFHVVFGKGFTVGAQRIRQEDGVRFSYSGEFAVVSDFESIWFDLQTTTPFFFWGDLDYAGMLILKTLKQSFVGLEAWQPGYEPMARAIEKGDGHSAESSSKTGQQFAGLTGCAYADQRLIAVIQQHQRFIDQEWV